MTKLQQAEKALDALERQYKFYADSHHPADQKKTKSIKLEIESVKKRIEKLEMEVCE